MLRWSRPSTLWSTYVIASGTATRSTSSSSNCIPAMVPVASSSRIWSTSSSMSSPGTRRPLRRCDSSSLWVRVRRAATGAGWYDPGVDGEVSRQALRLALGAELTHRAGRIAGGPIAADADLVALAGKLRAMAAPVERAHPLRFGPPFPRVTGGGGGLRDAPGLGPPCTGLHGAREAAAGVFTAP